MHPLLILAAAQPHLVAVLIWLLILAAIAAVVWWAIGAMGLPPPARIVAIAIFAIAAILLLAQLLPAFPGL